MKWYIFATIEGFMVAGLVTGYMVGKEAQRLYDRNEVESLREEVDTQATVVREMRAQIRELEELSSTVEEDLEYVESDSDIPPTFTDYASAFRKAQKDTDEPMMKTFVNQLEAIESIKGSESDPIHVTISEEEVGNIPEFYYESLRLFTDGFLCLEDTNEVLDRELLLGGALVFGGISGDPDIGYVRNHRLRADYEVVRMDTTYEENFGDIYEEPPAKKPKPRKMRPTDE